jgi:hypothetical protein
MNPIFFIIAIIILIIILLILFYPFFYSKFNKWKIEIEKQKQLEIEKQNNILKQKRELEFARLEKIRKIAIKEKEERLKIVKDKEVVENNSKFKKIFESKYKNARIFHEVQYTGNYRIPISDYHNYDLNIQGISFFIDNLKFSKGIGKIEVRHNNFEDTQFDIYDLEIIDGFAILKQSLRNKNLTPRNDYSSTLRKVFLTIRENSFNGINTNIVHKITFTPYSALDWK